MKKNITEYIIIFLNAITIIACFNYVMYSFLVGLLAIIDAGCMMILLLKNRKIHKRFLTYLVFVFSFAITGTMINHGGIGSLVILLNFILMVYLSTYIKIRLNTVKNIAFLYWILSIYWLVAGEISQYNTNTIGIIALMGMAYGIIFARIINNKLSFVIIFITLVVTYLLEKHVSHSRTCLLCGILLVILVYVIPAGIVRIKWIYWSIVSILTIGSLLWTRFYIYLYQANINITLTFMKEKRFFSGRELIWTEMWRKLKYSWLVGIGTSYQMDTFHGKFNVHNSMFNFLIVYGFPVFVLLVLLIFYKFQIISKNIENLDNKSLKYLGICCTFIIFIHGFTEVTLISSLFYGPIFTLFLLPNCEIELNGWKSNKKRRIKIISVGRFLRQRKNETIS